MLKNESRLALIEIKLRPLSDGEVSERIVPVGRDAVASQAPLRAVPMAPIYDHGRPTPRCMPDDGRHIAAHAGGARHLGNP
jgi:hypothetical protein